MENNTNIIVKFAMENMISEEIIGKAIKTIQDENIDLELNFRGNKTRKIATIKKWAAIYDREHMTLIDESKLSSSELLNLERFRNRITGTGTGNIIDDISVCELY